MKNVFSIGDHKIIRHTVVEADLAAFETGVVHPFYATFALGRDAEWACRQFVLEMLEDDEEGIGTFLNITHRSPAMLGDTVDITAEIIRLDGNAIDCSFAVKVGDRMVADGTQGQKILKKEKVQRLISNLSHGG
ncbi:MAG: hypothetical protein JNL57_02325 [Bacteroidetes bacterium]|nr:hypothetical protein [Bacteroidota bacterium]